MMEQNGVGRSSATEILRRQLDERRVDHEDDEEVTRFFGPDGFEVVIQGDIDGKLDCLTPLYLTPEQAIAATLGSVSEKDSEKDSDGRGECHNDGDQKDFLCSECGARMYTDTGETYTMIDSLGNIIEQPSFCPMCGRKVVSE